MLFDIPFKSATFCFIPLSRAENLAKTLVHSSISKRKRAKTRVLASCPHQNARFREGSAGFRRVPQGSAMVFLRISLAGQVPQGSARFREVPRRFRGFRKVPLRFPFRFPLGFPEGSAKVPRRFREVPRRFRGFF